MNLIKNKEFEVLQKELYLTYNFKNFFEII